MNEAFVVVFGLLTFLATCGKGVHWTFRCIYVPVLVLVPRWIELQIQGLPDLTALRAVSIGLVVGAVVSGRGSQLVPRWRWFDSLALIPVLSFSISYGLATDFKGFYHRLPVLALDWGCAYIFTRALLTDVRTLSATLRVFAVCCVALACLAVYECRMGARLAGDLWFALAGEYHVRPHCYSWRWGYLRASATFSDPIMMGTMFATVTPLMVLWGLLDRRYLRLSRIAALATGAACISSLSRGPILMLLAVAALGSMLGLRMRRLAALSFVGLVLMAPLLIEVGSTTVQHTRQRLETTGGTANESGYYRIALLLVYGKSVLHAGFFGDQSLVGREYESLWSMDNGYLYLFLLGGWIGGGVYCLIVITLLCRGARRILRTAGSERKVAAATVASFAAVAGCVFNVWFSADYAPYFWISAALIVNLLTEWRIGAPSYARVQQHRMERS